MPDDEKPDFFPKSPDGTEAAILDLVKSCELEDSYIRSYQVAIWKRNENYWEGIQNIFWSDNLGDWVSMGQNGLSVGGAGAEETRDSSGPLYDYVINIYKAHGDSIVAALSQSVPYVEFFPDDADNIEDLSTAKAKTKLSLIIQKHNKAKLRLMEILFRFYNQGLACVYRYRDRSEKHGTVKIPKYETISDTVTPYICPNCGKTLHEANEDDAELTSLPRCEVCNVDGVPGEVQERTQQKKVGEEKFPKAKEVWEILGPLNVKVPYYARWQAEFGYLGYYFELNVAKAWDKYPDFKDVITADASGSKERWSRTPPSYATNWLGSSEDVNLCSGKRYWFRPWQFELISGGRSDDEKSAIVDYLKESFPKGLHVTIITKKIVDAYEEDMDKSWVIRKCGLSSFIHTSPIGQGLVPIQEMTNQLANLTIETIEYGVPSLFADTEYLDFDTFGQQTTSPGLVTPAKAPPGHQLAEGFYEQKLATPSKEIETLRDRLDEDAQFVSGDYPSIYGGPSEGKSRTLGEYVQSGQRALARLSIMYEHLRELWADLNTLSVNEHSDEMKTFHYDEKMTQKDGQGFKTIKSNYSDLTGGAFYAECSEGFPISSDAKRQLLMQLLQVPAPEVMSVMTHPENSKIIAAAMAFPELYIPGEAQRFKALCTIKTLLLSAPAIEGQEGQPDVPSIEPEPEIDDAALQIEIFKVWLASENGMDARRNNPAGYANIKSYLGVLHNLLVMQTQEPNATPPGIPPATNMG
jgi:hypothetical protein